MTMHESGWIDVCAIDAIPARGSRVVKADAASIAVFRTASDEVFALLDRCPHAGGPLSQGIVHGKAVTCPLHNWVISLETGEALGADRGSVQPIGTKVRDGRILLRASDLAGLCRRRGTGNCRRGASP
jgi:nitrite reductase (NADH) small subunit